MFSGKDFSVPHAVSFSYYNPSTECRIPRANFYFSLPFMYAN